MQLIKIFSLASCLVVVTSSTGCSGFNSKFADKTESVEFVRVYDVKTNAKLKVVGEALLEGLSMNSFPTVARAIMTGGIPKEPGHFTLENPFAGTNLGLLINQAGKTPFRVMVCENSPWTASAERGKDTDSPTNFKVCVFPYQGGYHIDMFASMTKKSGGWHEISRAVAYGAVGSPEQWIEKTFLDAVRQVKRKTGAEITLIEAEPELEGTPWLDDNTDIEVKGADPRN